MGPSFNIIELAAWIWGFFLLTGGVAYLFGHRDHQNRSGKRHDF